MLKRKLIFTNDRLHIDTINLFIRTLMTMFVFCSKPDDETNKTSNEDSED